MDTVKHELLHIIGFTYGLYRHCLENNTSFKHLFDQSEVHLELRADIANNKLGECGITVPTLWQSRLRKIMATGALIPAVIENDTAVMRAIQQRSIDPLYEHTKLSASDQTAFAESPLPLGTVIDASLVATEYLGLLGTGFTKFAKAVDAAALTHDLLPLNAVMNFDRFNKAIAALPTARNNIYTRATL